MLSKKEEQVCHISPVLTAMAVRAVMQQGAKKPATPVLNDNPSHLEDQECDTWLIGLSITDIQEAQEHDPAVKVFRD